MNNELLLLIVMCGVLVVLCLLICIPMHRVYSADWAERREALERSRAKSAEAEQARLKHGSAKP